MAVGDKHFALTVSGGQLVMLPANERIEGHVHERDFYDNTSPSGAPNNTMMLAGDESIPLGANYAGDLTTGTKQIALGHVSGASIARVLMSTGAGATPAQVPEGTFIDSFLNQQRDDSTSTAGILDARLFELLVGGTNCTITSDYSVDPPTFTFDFAVTAGSGGGDLSLLLNLATPVLATEGALYKNVSPAHTANLRKLKPVAGEVLIDTDVTTADAVTIGLHADQRMSGHIDAGDSGTYVHANIHAKDGDAGLAGWAAAAAELLVHVPSALRNVAVLHSKKAYFSKDWVWETPVTGQVLPLMNNGPTPITVSAMVGHVRGTGSPSVTCQVSHHPTDVTLTPTQDLFTLQQTFNNALTDESKTPNSDFTIAANSMVWITLGTVGATTDSFWFELRWTEDA